MSIHRYNLNDFVTIQRQSFFELLEKGIIEEFSKRSAVTNIKKDLKFQFYPQYYVLTPPEYTPQEAIIKNKSYTCKLFIPAQLINLKTNKKVLKWFYIGNLPLMTKRGHFILNGATRVIVNQILRSPGIYYQQKLYENYEEKWSQKPDDSYKRFYADLICMRGTWLRIEIDKYKNIWAQTKKGAKIPIYWLLVAMGLSEKKIFKTITDSYRLLGNLSNNLIEPTPTSKGLANPLSKETKDQDNESVIKKSKKQTYIYVKNPLEAWQEIFKLVYSITPSNLKTNSNLLKNNNVSSDPSSNAVDVGLAAPLPKKGLALGRGRGNPEGVTKPKVPRSAPTLGSLAPGGSPCRAAKPEGTSELNKIYEVNFISRKSNNRNLYENNLADEGRKWLYNKFMNPRAYDLGKKGRFAFNRKLELNISPSQTTLTGLDVLHATDYLLKVEKGLFKIDDIDHLKNRRVRTSGELIQIQIAVGVVRLEKTIVEKINKLNSNDLINYSERKELKATKGAARSAGQSQARSAGHWQHYVLGGVAKQPLVAFSRSEDQRAKPLRGYQRQERNLLDTSKYYSNFKSYDFLINLVNSKAFNSAIREFFGTSPLSQFMDQINPLAELTHKRRLSSMGPGGVTRDTATLAIRGIHPTHYGRICPIETPEGKNTGLVNSMTTYARVNAYGIIESPFYKVYKGQVQKNTGMYYFSAEQEEKIKLAAADIFVSSIGFLPKSFIPVRIGEDFTKISRSQVQFVGVSALQMISIAASLIPFLEHDDANRALMGSNMQRQAVPLVRPERPIVGTGLEARAVSDSGHSVLAKYSGLVTYVSSNKIIVQTI